MRDCILIFNRGQGWELWSGASCTYKEALETHSWIIAHHGPGSARIARLVLPE